jgi:hypothetical protein
MLERGTFQGLCESFVRHYHKRGIAHDVLPTRNLAHEGMVIPSAYENHPISEHPERALGPTRNQPLTGFAAAGFSELQGCDINRIHRHLFPVASL